MYRCLDDQKTLHTIEKLEQRIRIRFPESGLADVCAGLQDSARQARSNLQWIHTPLWWLRAVAALVIFCSIAAIVAGLWVSEPEFSGITWPDLLAAFESGVNNILLAGAAVYFLTSIELRVKRSRAQRSLHELRALAHVVDMHQLTKNNSRIKGIGEPTKVSEQSMLTVQELTHYLDYCSEMLALIGKVSALYAQQLPDPEIISTVNELESLTTGLSRKIWQKIVSIQNAAQSV